MAHHLHLPSQPTLSSHPLNSSHHQVVLQWPHIIGTSMENKISPALAELARHKLPFEDLVPMLRRSPAQQKKHLERLGLVAATASATASATATAALSPMAVAMGMVPIQKTEGNFSHQSSQLDKRRREDSLNGLGISPGLGRNKHIITNSHSFGTDSGVVVGILVNTCNNSEFAAATTTAAATTKTTTTTSTASTTSSPTGMFLLHFGIYHRSFVVTYLINTSYRHTLPTYLINTTYPHTLSIRLTLSTKLNDSTLPYHHPVNKKQSFPPLLHTLNRAITSYHFPIYSHTQEKTIVTHVIFQSSPSSSMMNE